MEIKELRRPWQKPRSYGSKRDEFYQTGEWKRVRESFRASHPWCQECDKKGIRTPMYAVDHIKRIKDGGSRTDFSNLQSLCRSCHQRKSANEGNESRRKK